uniref:Uncharacterized protein n=1 Tax=Anopheles maculatus TaxID=74869 RepID=A0A182SMB0_9DIPT
KVNINQAANDHTGDNPETDTAFTEESHPASSAVTSSRVAVIVTQVSNDLIDDEMPPQIAEDMLVDLTMHGDGEDEANESDIDNSDVRDGGGGSVLVQMGSGLAEGSTEIKNYLVQNNDQMTGMEPSEPPIETTDSKPDGSKRTETNTVVDESDDGTIRTTTIFSTTLKFDGSEDMEEQLLKQLRDQQLTADQQDQLLKSPLITTTTLDPDTGVETTSTSTTRTTTTTKTITLTPDGDFPEDEILQKITTVTTHTTQPNVPEMVKETTVTVTEMVDGRTLDGAAKALNNIVDEFMNQERKN